MHKKRNMIAKEKYRLFILLNILIVFVTIVSLFFLMTGKNNEMPWSWIFTAFIISIPIILLQYPILQLKKNWFYKSVVFYFSMVLFLFVFGGVTAWNETVGSNAAGTWLARADAGLRMAIIGQLFGGVFGFMLIVFANYLMKDKLFRVSL